jgi:hypothetical protein
MVGFLKRLFGGSSGASRRPTEAAALPRLTSGGLFDVVGEASYQSALERISGGRGEFSAEHQCKAILAPEDGNPHDPNAVQVLIDGKVVGYLARAHAAEYRQHVGAVSATCDAKIVGGWDDGETVGSFGVKLKVKWPPKIAKAK